MSERLAADVDGELVGAAAPAPSGPDAAPMRVDVCLTEFPVLSETFVLGQITGLVDRGHDVRIVALRRGDTSLVHPDVTRYALLERLEPWGDSYSLMPRGKPRRLLRALGLLARAEPARRRVLLGCLDPRRHGRDALTLNLFFRAHRAMARPRPADVALCHFAQVGERFARLLECGATDTPVATVYHGHDLACHQPIDPARPPYPALFRAGALHLPVSDHWRRALLDAGVPDARVAVHHMGIRTADASSDEGSRSAPDAVGDAAGDAVSAEPPFRVLTVCRFVEKKGVRHAIEAFAAFAAEHPGASYRIVGDGPLRDELVALAAARASAPGVSIRVDGPVDADGVRRALAEADVFLLPSVTAADGDQEGIPVVLMEAMAAGPVVVSSRHSGIPELVEHDVSGLLAPERDEEALAAALARLRADAALRHRLAAAARRRVAHDFDVDRLNARLVARLAAVRAVRTPARAGAVAGPA